MLAPKLFAENNLFNDFFNDYGFMKAFDNIDQKLYGKHAIKEMLTDVRDKGDHYELLVDLPGFHKENIKVELDEGYLTITAEKGIEEKDDNNGRFVRQERYYGTMQRSFYVGEAIKVEDITGKFEGGVLAINIPKKEEQKALPANNQITIE